MVLTSGGFKADTHPGGFLKYLNSVCSSNGDIANPVVESRVVWSGPQIVERDSL